MKISKDIAAIVTGAASGLGEAVARTLSERSAKIAVFDVDEKRGEKVAEACGGVFCCVDVSDPASVAAGLETARAQNGQERVLVNCAGIAPGERTISSKGPHRAEVFQKVLDVNLSGVFNCATQSAAGMAELGALEEGGECGVIVNTASIAAFEGQIGQIAYAASKAGVAGLTLPMARDLVRHGIRVMAIAPGIFMTPLLSSLPQEVQDSLVAKLEFPARAGEPHEFAALVTHIIENPMLNGEVIRLDGAYRMPPS